MAIDTRDKRASCLGLLAPNRIRCWSNPPDFVADQADRQHSAYSYRGILAGAPPVNTSLDGFSTMRTLTGVGR